MIPYLIIGIIAYLIGSINFSIIISKKITGIDVREKGSGNAGTTNVLRTVGKKAAVLTLICDILKGLIAVLIAYLVGVAYHATQLNKPLLIQIAGVAVILGHTFPIFFGFKGGKGIATSLGILLIINWKIGLICLIFALIIMAITRMVSVGSLVAAILFPILTVFITDSYLVPGFYLFFGIIIALLVMYNHRKNIQRLLAGNENKLNFGGNK